MTPDGNLSLDEWSLCAQAALAALHDEIAALDDAEQARVLDVVLLRCPHSSSVQNGTVQVARDTLLIRGKA